MDQVTQLINRASRAQREFEASGQVTLDTAAAAAAWVLIKPDNNQQLAKLAVQATGLGNVADKIIKNHRKTLGLLRDMQGIKTLGIVRQDSALGITELRRPMGVVAAITPSTNPIATPANNIINALKTGNAIIIAPSPKGISSAKALLALIHAEFNRIKLPLTDPCGLVQMLPEADRNMTNQLMSEADIVVVTGSQANVCNGYKSGTPALGVGVGNVTVIIDSSANLADAAEKIAQSKTFDNATSCSSENSLIVLKNIANPMQIALEAAGGMLLTDDDKTRLQHLFWQEGKLNRDLIAQDATHLLNAINVQRQHENLTPLTSSASLRFLMVRETQVGSDHPYSGEKMAPILTLYQVDDFNAAIAQADKILKHQGQGHSVGIHTTDKTQPLQIASQLPACRVIVNQAHCFAAGGAFNNGLPFSLSMGCGAWGGNSFSGNFNFQLLTQQVLIAESIKPNEPTVEDLFSDYWQVNGK